MASVNGCKRCVYALLAYNETRLLCVSFIERNQSSQYAMIHETILLYLQRFHMLETVNYQIDLSSAMMILMPNQTRT